jgi:tetratricopeptide (TPR) repeat protein
MSHLEPEALRRILSGEDGPQEADGATEHIVSCERCQALAGTVVDELRREKPGLRGDGPAQLVFDLVDRERRWGVESLAALAEWAKVRRLPGRRSQRDHVRMSKECHTLAFFQLALGELKEAASWDEAEFVAGLALLSAEAMIQRKQITPSSGHDLQAEVWTAVANARRLAAEWKRAHQALANAERHLEEGTGKLLLKAGLLSITASTRADEGQVSQALDALEKCRAIYEGRSEWALLARTLVQTANVLAGKEPVKGLVALDHAAPLIPAEDLYLTLLAELLRVECLIEIQKPSEALQAFRRCSRLLIAYPKIRMQIRGKFTGARLLDALGFKQQAERLFYEVVDQDVEHELYKDAYLDLLYLYERHVKSGDLEGAAGVCRKALTDPSLSGIAHEQIRDLWTQLLETTQHRPIRRDSLEDLRRYLNVHWKHPAATPPVVAFR